jgi:Holliday junction resolvase-like predicted endonuclease
MPRKIQGKNNPDFDKVWLMFQETDKKFQETDKKIKELAGLFTTQWGKLVEALVEPSCLKLFQDRGIQIEQSFQNVKAKYGKHEMECDILLVNNSELVVVEVKTTFKPEYATEFADKLKLFKKIFPQYKGYKVIGAVAALKYEGQSDKFAYRQGVFVLRCTGEGIIKIMNDKKFIPKEF